MTDDNRRHLTIPQAAVAAGVRPITIRSLVEQGHLASECRLPRRENGELVARASVPQHMIDPGSLEESMADAEGWTRACEDAFKRMVVAPAPAPRITAAKRKTGAVRKRLEDRLEAKRIGIPVEEWAL